METRSEKVIEVLGLRKVFKDFWGRPKAEAVDSIDFNVSEGEIFGLLGPNGSGKSTTIKIILGLLYPTKGTVRVFGKNPSDVRTKSRIGYLPEESYLYKYLTALETLDFFGSIFNIPASERRRRSEQLLEMVGLSHVKNRQTGEFSKGMMRRIGIAQAMINDPDLLILDEPTSGLDPIGCREIKDLIKFLKTRGKTVLISSHLLSDVEDLCDKVIILYGGKIRASGTIEELLTVSDASRIITPLLDPELRESISAILAGRLGGQNVKIDHPRKSLEQFFLEVVKKARDEMVSTSGVSGGGIIAEYLKKSPEEILGQLTAPEEELPVSNVKDERIEPIAPDAMEKLEKLSTDQPSAEQHQNQEEKEDLAQANQKLKEILSADKDPGEK